MSGTLEPFSYFATIEATRGNIYGPYTTGSTSVPALCQSEFLGGTKLLNRSERFRVRVVGVHRVYRVRDLETPIPKPQLPTNTNPLACYGLVFESAGFLGMGVIEVCPLPHALLFFLLLLLLRLSLSLSVSPSRAYSEILSDAAGYLVLMQYIGKRCCESGLCTS